MKNILFLIPAIALFVGCGTTSGPLVTQTSVFVGASAAIHNNPNLLPAAKAGAELLCAVADGTNANPVSLVAALDAAGPWTFEEWLLLNGLVVVVVEAGANANSGSDQPYLKAGCIGLRMAVAGAPQDAPQERSAPSVSPKKRRVVTQAPSSPKWPQMRYP